LDSGILPVMSEESTTPDMVELTRTYIETVNRRDFDAMESVYTPDVVLHGELIGMFEGRAAARGFMEDRKTCTAPTRSFAARRSRSSKEILDLGNGLIFTVYRQEGRLAGTSGLLTEEYAILFEIVDGVAVRVTNYADIDEARAVAERLGKERSSQRLRG
jgi:ketosteroid isomerase-like protein